MASFVYNAAKKGLGDGSIDWDTDSFKVAFLTSSHTPDTDNDVYFSDLDNEVSGGGYTTGGYSLANNSVSIDNTNDRAKYDADDVSATGLTTTFRYLVVYKNTGTPATSPLVCMVDLGSDYALTNGTMDITWNTAGVFTLN